MQTPEWLKPGLYGAACGAIALAIVGFYWGGWVTGGTAAAMAATRSRADVVTALTAICVDQSKHDPLSLSGSPASRPLVWTAAAISS